MRPKNSPTRMYWVEALYDDVKAGRPQGGKFTRRDSAKRRRAAIRLAGGESRLYVHTMDNWKVVEEDMGLYKKRPVVIEAKQWDGSCEPSVFEGGYLPVDEASSGPWLDDEIETGHHLLWHSGHKDGYQPGSFHEKIIEALSRADIVNTEKILNAFPHYRRPLVILRTFGSDALADAIEEQVAG